MPLISAADPVYSIHLIGEDRDKIIESCISITERLFGRVVRPYFFVRFDLPYAHLRWRMVGWTSDDLKRFLDEVDSRRIVFSRQHYEFEVFRYGGLKHSTLTYDSFHRSSAMVGELLVKKRGMNIRSRYLAAAVYALIVASVAELDAATTREWLKSLEQAWTGVVFRLSGLDVGDLSNPHRWSEDEIRVLSAVFSDIQNLKGALKSIHQQLKKNIDSLIFDLKVASREEKDAFRKAVPQAMCWSTCSVDTQIILGYIASISHMHNNRLGLSNVCEAQLYRSLRVALL